MIEEKLNTHCLQRQTGNSKNLITLSEIKDRFHSVAEFNNRLCAPAQQKNTDFKSSVACFSEEVE